MGISRDERHKRRPTGGKRPIIVKKHKYELGRQSAMTKIGAKRIHTVRVRGGNLKYRALRLDTGNYAWASESVARKTRIIDVVYNASNNELVRTKTLVKGSIVQVDATPFRQWYESHYGVPLGRKKIGSGKKGEDGKEIDEPERKKSHHVTRKLEKRKEGSKLDPQIVEQFVVGRLYARIASRPGQSGRCDGYILEGKELEFYVKKLRTKKTA